MIIFGLMMSLFVDALFTDENNAAIGELVNQVIAFITQPVTFAWGRAFTLYFQGVALTIAVFAIAVNGIRSGILINGGTEDESAGHYIFRSLWPVAVIAGSPAIFSFVTAGVGVLIDDLAPSATGIDFGALISSLMAMQSNVVTQIVCIFGGLAVVYYTVTIVLHCIKRQYQLAVLSVIGPLVAAMTVSENNSGDMVTLLKEMLGIGVTTALQLALLMTAIALPGSGALDGIPLPIQPFAIVAAFGAIKQMPRWIERYSLAPAVSGSNGVGRAATMAAGFIGRSAISKAMR